MDIRVGNGYDTHPLVKGESLILGGINIPHVKGTKGHSDGDVLTHAIIDSLLGATSLGDIGKFFPSNSATPASSSISPRLSRLLIETIRVTSPCMTTLLPSGSILRRLN